VDYAGGVGKGGKDSPVKGLGRFSPVGAWPGDLENEHATHTTRSRQLDNYGARRLYIFT